MRKVIDSNMLRDPALRDYLSRLPSNYAVLTDYAAMEAYKGNSLESIHSSMAIVAEYPAQVIVLKGTQTLCGLRARGAGLERRMIDEGQTAGFADYCRELARAKTGDGRLQKKLLGLAADANTQMDRMLADASTTAEAIKMIEKSYTTDELRIFRTGAAYSDRMMEKLASHVLQLAAELFKSHPKARPLTKSEDVRNSFIFRVALCGYLLAINWIAVGGASKASPKKIRNDMVDVNFAVSATYFDGILSADEKLVLIYFQAKHLLDHLFISRGDSQRHRCVRGH